MDAERTSGKTVAVIGGGISGLATTHRLHELAPHVTTSLLERSDQLGGVVETVRMGNYLLESGPDNFITNIPWGVDLCRRVGLEDQLLETRDGHRAAFVVRRGRLRKIPQGFIIMAPSRMWPMITTPILSPLGKLRLAAEYFVRKRTDDADESLADFVIRRLGRETYDRLVQPLIGGIYTGDPRQLSVLATMPRFRELEQKYGSMTRGMLQQAAQRRPAETQSSGGRYSMFMTLRDGLSSLFDTLARRVPAGTIQLQSPVETLRRLPGGRYHLEIGGARPRQLTADAVVLATQANAAAVLLRGLDAKLSGLLGEIHHSGCIIVTMAFRRDQIAHRMDGFGFVVPIAENRKILSGSFASVKYDGRAPEGHALIRVFIGGACQPELLELDDDQLRALALAELRELMGVRGEPDLVRTVRYPESMPQYYVGHQQRVAAIQQHAGGIDGFFLTGNAYHGVGMPLCIHGGEETAQQVSTYLEQDKSPAEATSN